MVVSSVSPERAETMDSHPAALAAFKAASVSLKVPAWFGLIKAVLQAPMDAALWIRAALVQMKSSAITSTLVQAAVVNFAIASASSSPKGSSMATMG